jgi:glycine betaine catabolism B
MIKTIDSLLNRFTMYRLVLYYLIFLLAAALVMSIAGSLNYNPFALIFSTAFLLGVSAFTNWIFGRVFNIPTNAESAYITALILALIINPIQSYNDLWFLLWAAILAIAAKFVIPPGGRHIFNPAAFAVALTYLTINQSASWWVGNAQMLPFVLVGGALVVRKIRRGDLVLSFLGTALVTISLANLLNGSTILTGFQEAILYSPLLFFAFVMITEPRTTPPTYRLRIYYGALVGFLFAPLFHIGSFYTTPELALLVGNIFSYVVSPKKQLVLTLKDKIRLAPNIYEFVFSPGHKFAYEPGQYMEWTLGFDDTDSRGNRRYFTLSSAPTEHVLKLGVKFSEQSSAFKEELLSMGRHQEIWASHLAGDFVLPKNHNQSCVFIAGGIGITPFRSMIKYLVDNHQRRPITLFYVNNKPDEIVYRDVFEQAEKDLGIKTFYTLTDSQSVPADWKGLVGRIKPEWIQKMVPHYQTSLFYLSGPVGMIQSTVDILHQLGVKDKQIKSDYFSGL